MKKRTWSRPLSRCLRAPWRASTRRLPSTTRLLIPQEFTKRLWDTLLILTQRIHLTITSFLSAVLQWSRPAGSVPTALKDLSCAGSLFLDDNWTVPNEDYGAYLKQLTKDERAANGNYEGTWTKMDYSDDYENIACSALIVHGLNDFNVLTKQSDLMYKAFKKAGQNVKIIWHQDGHLLRLHAVSDAHRLHGRGRPHFEAHDLCAGSRMDQRGQCPGRYSVL